MLYTKHPDAGIWQHGVFSTSLFHEFANSTALILEQTEADAAAELHRLPQNMADTLRGITANSLVQHHLRFDNMQASLTGMHSMITNLEAVFFDNLRGNGRGSRGKGKARHLGRCIGHHVHVKQT